MTNHYKTLGVDRDATPEQIRAARRKKASSAHPDKGGTDGQMQDINRAYAVLSDPDLRKRYDETGADAPAEPAARQVAMQTFAQILLEVVSRDNVNLVKEVERRSRTAKVNLASQETDARRKITRLEARLKKLRFIGNGIDLVRNTIEGAVADERRKLAQIEQAREVGEIVMELAQSYEDETEEQVAAPWGSVFMTTTTARGY